MNPEIERVGRPRGQARQAYNSMSRWYDLISGSERRLIELGIHMLGVRPGESVLEIGCGTGRALAAIAKIGAPGMMIGLDISEDMLRIARKRFAQDTPAEQIELCQGDGLYLPFVEGRFDAVFLSFTLELFDTPELTRVARECHRILKSDGRFASVTLAWQDRVGVRVYEWFHRHIPKYVDCRPISVKPILEEVGYTIRQLATESMWRLPVDIVLAGKTS